MCCTGTAHRLQWVAASQREAFMPNDSAFQDLIRRVRAGEQDAATELVRRYEPAIRRVVRLRLTDARLRRAFDSMDVCQSVLASFFVRAALGQYDLDSPEELLKLLAQMARYKATDRMRRERATRRDLARRDEDSGAGAQAVAADASPSQQVAGRELLVEFRKRLSPDERELADLRAEGREWADIAKGRDESAEALRKRLARGLDRVAQQLGLDEAAP
jgi:RNA polymerase sigma-70 factor (ECF subfamily)